MERTEKTMFAANRKNNVKKTTTTYGKKLQNTLESTGVITIPEIKEVCIFKDDETIIQFLNPKVEASVGANAWVVSGSPQTKNLRDILSGLINQLSPVDLRKFVEQLQKQVLGAIEGATATPAQEDDDEDS